MVPTTTTEIFLGARLHLYTTNELYRERERANTVCNHCCATTYTRESTVTGNSEQKPMLVLYTAIASFMFVGGVGLF